ncbi:MAG: septation protein IspZ [Albidovulum sp.]|nr:septation protein IspZ [Albidovulum sp.]
MSKGKKTLFDLGPVFVFFASYMALRNRVIEFAGHEYSGFIVATAIFIPVLLVSTFLYWRLAGKVSRMQVSVAVIAVVFGGMSLWFNDERFFKIKPTITYLLFAGILTAGMIRGKSGIQYVMDESLPLTTRGWHLLTWRMIAFFVCLAGLNEFIWRTMSTNAWVNFKTFGIFILFFLFFFLNRDVFVKYSKPPESEGEAA